MRDELQAELAAAFNDDLADAVYSFTCERTTKSNWNPVTETYTNVTVNYSGRGIIFGGFNSYEIANLGILAADKNAKKGKIDEITRATQFEKILLGDGINKITENNCPLTNIKTSPDFVL